MTLGTSIFLIAVGAIIRYGRDISRVGRVAANDRPDPHHRRHRRCGAVADLYGHRSTASSRRTLRRTAPLAS